ncbi:MAG: hypothetical protein K2X82_12465 [Gemmataceae bacterium]|nr:hypothetical protein [Gemmataceae bacterium]
MFAPLFRALLATAAVVALLGTLDAQIPDPDAKGTITITSVTASGTTLKAKGKWAVTGGADRSSAGIKLWAIHKTKRKLYDVSRASEVELAPDEWASEMGPMPNGEYEVIAFNELAYKNNKQQGQLVVSKFNTGTISVTGNDTATVEGSITITATRSGDNVTIGGSGTWMTDKGYTLDTSVAIGAAPVDGGRYRTANAGSVTGIPNTNGTWGNCQVVVNGQLNYKVAAFARVCQIKSGQIQPPQYFIVSNWQDVPVKK